MLCLRFAFQGPSASAYVTYIRSEDALRAIQCVNNVVVDGRTLKVRNSFFAVLFFLINFQAPFRAVANTAL